MALDCLSSYMQVKGRKSWRKRLDVPETKTVLCPFLPVSQLRVPTGGGVGWGEGGFVFSNEVPRQQLEVVQPIPSPQEPASLRRYRLGKWNEALMQGKRICHCLLATRV